MDRRRRIALYLGRKPVEDCRIVAPDGWQEIEDSKLAWLVIAEIWEWVDFYGDYETFRLHMAALSEGQRAIYATTWLDSEVKNGGFFQFFENGTGMLGPEALNGFKAIGMDESVAAIEAAFDHYSMSPYPRERADRVALLPEYESGKTARFKFDDAYYQSTYDKSTDKEFDSILPRMQARYIRTHPDQFFR